eukprot:TRINITY_DN3821_c0_g1_i1.p1 TRINITY_DN3821_c0_g1~~TRINITY_DN3821_c0_g1_i1.p1  ORF type:complete len:284 (-),score=80.89 TRINITY_DN3821_c0_g1_i1:346-1197(-)
MARNEEKSQSMLNRFLQMKQEERGISGKERRPYLASQCGNVPDCEKWRMQILKEIGRKVTQIQNAGLGEYRLRDLNDEINKLIREKAHWERRIIELGGPNYFAQAPKIFDADGQPIGGPSEYKYFGEAKNLPGVKELLQSDAQAEVQKRTRYEMYRSIDADYYGYRDEEDGLLVRLEEVEEEKRMKKAVEKWEAENREAKRQKLATQDFVPSTLKEKKTESTKEQEDSLSRFVSYVPIPSKQQIENLISEKKKQDLLKRYVSPELQQNLATNQDSVKAVTGRT